MHILVIAATVLAVGCSEKKQRTLPTPAPAATVQAAPPPKAPAPTQAAAPNVAVSDELAQQCKLRFGNPTEAPKFDFDEAELEAADRDVLEQIAQCVTRGPLQGRAVELIGRADPRGTDEYNLGLGARRAESVSQYLRRLGVPPQQLAQTTRGELDAKGTDEDGWRADRRVDVTLSN